MSTWVEKFQEIWYITAPVKSLNALNALSLQASKTLKFTFRQILLQDDEINYVLSFGICCAL